MASKPKNKESIFFYILIRSWKSFNNFDNCVDSALAQKYKKFKIIFIDDCSNLTVAQAKHIKEKLKNHIVILNTKRKYSIRNAYEAIHKHAVIKNSVVFNLDGDDWLPNSKCLKKVAKIYTNNTNIKLTYGDCQIWKNGKVFKKSARYIKKYTNIPYTKINFYLKNFRSIPFLPLHPRTWKTSLYKQIPKKEFMDSNGRWLRFAEDLAIFFPMLEMINPNEYEVLKTQLYAYNIENKHSDVTENTIPLLKDEICIRKKYSKKDMDQKREKLILEQSGLMSVKLIGQILYRFQILLLKHKLISTIYASPKKNKIKNELFNLLSPNQNLIIRSENFQLSLDKIKAYKILDLSKNIKWNNVTKLYGLMWNIVLCDAVTKKTKRSLSRIIPSDINAIHD